MTTTGWTKAEAARQVDIHVEPKECFVTTDSGKKNDWRPLGGTGCAHWVSHQLGFKGGHPGSDGCDAGYLIRVPSITEGKHLVDLNDVSVNDIWTNLGKTHTGLVVRVEKSNDGKVVDLTIKHCSSAQGGVVESPWKAHFSGRGIFYRVSVTTAALEDRTLRFDKRAISYLEPSSSG